MWYRRVYSHFNNILKENWRVQTWSEGGGGWWHMSQESKTHYQIGHNFMITAWTKLSIAYTNTMQFLATHSNFVFFCCKLPSRTMNFYSKFFPLCLFWSLKLQLDQSKKAGQTFHLWYFVNHLTTIKKIYKKYCQVINPHTTLIFIFDKVILLT